MHDDENEPHQLHPIETTFRLTTVPDVIPVPGFTAHVTPHPITDEPTMILEVTWALCDGRIGILGTWADLRAMFITAVDALDTMGEPPMPEPVPFTVPAGMYDMKLIGATIREALEGIGVTDMGVLTHDGDTGEITITPPSAYDTDRDDDG